MATFWTTDYNGSGVTNPKRAFRFKITIGAFSDTSIGSDLGTNVVFWAKTADKPSFTLGETSHNYLNHTFKFPGRVTWNDVTITMVDPGGEKGVAFALTKILNESGYVVPTDASQFQTISKTKAVGGLGEVLCQQLDDEGNVLESWTLNNSFISDVNFGNLDYGSEELTEYSITVRYDWATYNEGLGSEVSYKASS
tara:strand:- start:290 stop:877 length:588 start_codon:yes stop_codon:yes gene_type:complete